MEQEVRSDLDSDAIYYPYVHIRNEEWLKRTLLVFRHIVRMVPDKDSFLPRDSEFIRELVVRETRRGPLLRPASLVSSNVQKAQTCLLSRIEADISLDPAFKDQYGKAAADRLKNKRKDPGFQMHPAKSSDALIWTLHNHGLAWVPERADYEGYLELHPRLGQLVLSTIAMACAEDEGLDFVTDPKDKASQQINSLLSTRDADNLYDSWMRPAEQASSPSRAGGRAIIELIVYNHCDPTKLTPERLVDLSDDREALANFKRELKAMADSIPAMMDETKLQDRLKERPNMH